MLVYFYFILAEVLKDFKIKSTALEHRNTLIYSESININNLLSAGHDDGLKAYSNNIKHPLFPLLYVLYLYKKDK